jgi:hypothetical protein
MMLILLFVHQFLRLSMNVLRQICLIDPLVSLRHRISVIMERELESEGELIIIQAVAAASVTYVS